MAFHLLSVTESVRLGITIQEPSPVSLATRLICYSFVHEEGVVLFLNCSALAYVTALLARRCSVLDVFRLISLGGFLGGLLYLLASWVFCNDTPLCGGQTALMACCTAMLVLDPGREVGKSVRGQMKLVCICLFLGGWLSCEDNLRASLIAMVAGLGGGIVYGVVIRSVERGWRPG